jgi:capsular exopolysaccharide synthesis family protein
MILVSSAMPGDGKTISALNLAAALSMQEGIRVLLVDCDFRRSSLTRLLGLQVTPGLGDVLRGDADVEASLVQTEQFPNLYFLPSGETSKNPAELLTTARWQAVKEVLCSEFRFLVIDAPPVGGVAEYELLQLASDGVLLVIREGYTNRQLLKNALEAVPQRKKLGVILNCVEDWLLWKTNSYYYYSGKDA